MTDAATQALTMTFAMGWQILWPLILGFTLSGICKREVAQRDATPPSRRPPTVDRESRSASAPLLPHALLRVAVALARSVFRGCANFTAAMAFELASTNLVLRTDHHHHRADWAGSSRWLEFVGAPIMVAALVLLFRLFLSPRLIREAKEQASIVAFPAGWKATPRWTWRLPWRLPFWQRITSDEGRTAISHYFVMDWASVWMDIVGGLLIAGALAAWVPNEFWQAFFFVDSSGAAGKFGDPSDRACSRNHFVRLLGRQHSARCGALEWWHQFRRCGSPSSSRI